MRKAAAAGIRCEVVSDSRHAFHDACQVLRRDWDSLTDTEVQAGMNHLRALLARPETTVAVARDEHGRPLAVSAAVIDDMVCVIFLAVATCHEARWGLHDHLVRILIARRVKYLLVEGGGPFGALGFGPNVQHYQHLMGYQLRHVTPVPADSIRLRRRLLASLTVVTTGAALIAAQTVDLV